jgi:hypothetical protein
MYELVGNECVGEWMVVRRMNGQINIYRRIDESKEN